VDELGNVYRIIHDKRVALFEEHQEPLLHETVQRILPESIIGYEMVNGLGCAVRNVLLNGLPAGKEYIYRPFALIVKTTAMDPTGRSEIVRELYDIKVAEPDPALLRIPEGYTVVNQPK
jgi:hypothetical protein